MSKYVVIGILGIAIIVGYIFTNSREGADRSNLPPVQSHRSYQAVVLSDIRGLRPNQAVPIRYRIRNDRGEILKNFSVVHEKIMHLIVVRKDLQYFQHLHPTFNQISGEFSADITFPEDGPYRIFSDFTPAASEDNPMQLPVTSFFDAAVGDNYGEIPVMVDKANKKTVEDYEVTFLFPKQELLRSQTQIMYSLRIEKSGKPVESLEDYLGAKGHSVVLKKGTLDFIHTHAMEEGMDMEHMMDAMGGMEEMEKNEPSRIDFSTTFPAPGIYKIFTQFQHNGKAKTTDYTLQIQ